VFRLGCEQQEQQSKVTQWKHRGISTWKLKLTWTVWLWGEKTPKSWYKYVCGSRINLKLFHSYGTLYEITSCKLRDQNIYFQIYISILSHRLSGGLTTTRQWERAFGSATCIFQEDYLRVCLWTKRGNSRRQRWKEVCLLALFLHFLGVHFHISHSHLDCLPPTDCYPRTHPQIPPDFSHFSHSRPSTSPPLCTTKHISWSMGLLVSRCWPEL